MVEERKFDKVIKLAKSRGFIFYTGADFSSAQYHGYKKW